MGVRPEYVALAETGIAATIAKVSDVGRHYVVDAIVGDASVKCVLDHDPPEKGSAVCLQFRPDKTRVYRDGWIATEVRP